MVVLREVHHVYTGRSQRAPSLVRAWREVCHQKSGCGGRCAIFSQVVGAGAPSVVTLLWEVRHQ